MSTKVHFSQTIAFLWADRIAFSYPPPGLTSNG